MTFAGNRDRPEMDYKVDENADVSRCLQCGSVIDYGGRPDRKFCCAGCKNRYHNYRRFRRRDTAQRSVFGRLEKNYEILDNIIHLGLGGMDRPKTSLFAPGHGGAHQADEGLYLPNYRKALEIFAMGILEADALLD